MYDYYLDGKDNYQVDRDAVDRVEAAMPEIRQLAWENRAFLRRTVRYMARQGIDQFLDIGPGLRLIDFTRPVGVLLIAMIHFISQEDRPRIMGYLCGALPPGSHLTATHVTTDGHSAEAVAQIERVYATTPTPIYFRDHAEVGRFFDGLELAEPGLVTVDAWGPDPDDPAPPATRWLYGGVGRKN